jgi:hypothetical protein
MKYMATFKDGTIIRRTSPRVYRFAWAIFNLKDGSWATTGFSAGPNTKVGYYSDRQRVEIVPVVIVELDGKKLTIPQVQELFAKGHKMRECVDREPQFGHEMYDPAVLDRVPGQLIDPKAVACFRHQMTRLLKLETLATIEQVNTAMIPMDVDSEEPRLTLKQKCVNAVKMIGAGDTIADRVVAKVGRLVMDDLMGSYLAAALKSDRSADNADARVAQANQTEDWGWARYFRGEAHGYRMAADLIKAIIEGG